MIKILCWSIPISLAIGAIAYATAIYNIEDAKQNAFMMKVCTDAGGDWLKTWNNRYYCQRPKG